jgi:hypothetical protein
VLSVNRVQSGQSPAIGVVYRMFATLIRICQWLGTLCALLAPIAIVHWLGDALALPGTAEFTALLGKWLAPINAFTASILPFTPPVIDYNKRAISTLEPISAILGIILFTASIQIARLLEETEKKLVIEKSKIENAQRARKFKAEKESIRRDQATFDDILVYVTFPFQQSPHLGKAFYQFTDYGGREMPSYPGTLMAAFTDVTMALAFTIQMTNMLNSHYRTLKISETKHPFTFVIHSTRPGDTFEESLAVCAQINRYAGPYQTLLSETLQKMLVARSMAAEYKQNSLGFYSFPGGSQQEVFVLHPTLPKDQQVLY